jgi:hypothetical protein
MDETPKAPLATEPSADPKQKTPHTTGSLRVRSHLRAGIAVTIPNF